MDTPWISIVGLYLHGVQGVIFGHLHQQAATLGARLGISLRTGTVPRYSYVSTLVCSTVRVSQYKPS